MAPRPFLEEIVLHDRDDRQIACLNAVNSPAKSRSAAFVRRGSELRSPLLCYALMVDADPPHGF